MSQASILAGPALARALRLVAGQEGWESVPKDEGAPLAVWPEGKPACCPVGASSCDLSELTLAVDI